MSALLDRSQILNARKVPTETVPVPEWGGDVLVRGLTGRQRDEFEATLIERRGKKMVTNTANARARLVVWCLVDEHGNRMFGDGDAEEMGEHSAAALNRVYEVAARLSGMTDEDLDELVTDFGNPSGSSSNSSSPSSSEPPSDGSSTTPTPAS